MNIKIFFALFLFVAISFAQIDVGTIGTFSHFVSGNFRRAGWGPSGNINGWDVAAQRWTRAGGASFTGGSVSDISPVGTDGLLAVGSFTAVDGKRAIGIAYFNGATWCGMPHLNLYRYSASFPPVTQFPRKPPTANGRAYAIDKVGNDYYIFGGNLANGQPNFNMIGTSVRFGVAGLAKLTFANNNFTVDTTSINYRVTPAIGYNATEDTTRATGYPASSATTPIINTPGTSKIRVIGSGANVFVIYKDLTSTASVDLRLWGPNYHSWVSIASNGTQNILINSITTTTTFTIFAPRLNNIRDFEVSSRTNPTIFVSGAFNTTDTGFPANERYFNVASFTYSPSATTFTYVNALNPTQEMLSINMPGNDGVRALAVLDAQTYYIASFQQFQYSDQGATLYQRTFHVYRVASGTPTIVGETTRARFINTAQPTNNPIQKLVLNGNTIHAFGTFNLYNYQSSTSKSTTRFINHASGWAVFQNDWTPVFGGGMTSGGANIVPTQIAIGTSRVYVYAQGATQTYDLFTNGLVGFDDRSNVKQYKTFGTPRFTNRGTVVGGSSFPIGSDGEVRTVHFLKSQRSGVDDALLIGGTFDWIGLDLVGSVAFLRLRTNSFESVGGGLWVDNTDFSLLADASVPQFLAGKVNDFEERSDVLYAAGAFSKNINDACLSNVARLNFKDTTAVWTSLGTQGCNGEVLDLLAVGSRIYAGGMFTNCGGTRGTRYVAYFDEDDDEWKPLNTGLNANVHALARYRGELYAAGVFSLASNIQTNAANGIARWDGENWEAVLSRCQVDCQVGPLEFPFVSPTTPHDRSPRVVSSLKVAGGRLYAQATTPISGNHYLVRYDGTSWRQLGAATAAGPCPKQGCLATNGSDVIAINFNSAAQPGYTPNYQQYDADENVWVETLNGFDANVIMIASASHCAVSIVLILLFSILSLLLF